MKRLTLRGKQFPKDFDGATLGVAAYLRLQAIEDKEERTEKTPSSKQKTAPKPPKLDVGFEKFWAAYPRKVAKTAAISAFKKIKPDGELLGKMLKTIELSKSTEQWEKGIVPNPSTWLNQGRWDDEFPEKSSAEHSYDLDIFDKLSTF